MTLDEQNYCLITFSDLYGLYPVGYQERLYFKGRPVKIQPHEEVFVTEDKLQTVFDTHYQQRIIQALIYDKYELKLLCKENYNVEPLKYANTILIFAYKEKKQYKPVIEEINVTEVSGTNFKEVTIVFWDKFIDNYYKGYPVINHLRSDSLLNRGYTGTQLTKVALVPVNHDTWSTTYNFYSPFYLTKSVSSANKQDIDLNGRLYNSRITSKGYDEILLYLNEDDAFNLAYYGNLCNTYNGRIEVTEPGESVPIQLELPEINVEQVKGAVNLYKCTVKYTHQLINNLTFST